MSEKKIILDAEEGKNLKAFVKDALQIYQDGRCNFKDFYESEKYYFTPKIMSNISTVLDIGCATGGFGNALKKQFNNKLSYTGIDVNRTEIKNGKKAFPKQNFIRGIFPTAMKDSQKYDLVCAFGFFHMVVKWKQMLSDLIKHSKKYVNISVVCRLEGTTVTDKDLSYYYYLDTGERAPSIAINIRELLNYCCHHELKVKRIGFYGYNNKASRSTAFRPIREKDTIYGNLFLELFDSEKQPKRFGGLAPEQTKARAFVPETKIVINGKKWNNWR